MAYGHIARVLAMAATHSLVGLALHVGGASPAQAQVQRVAVIVQGEASAEALAAALRAGLAERGDEVLDPGAVSAALAFEVPPDAGLTAENADALRERLGVERLYLVETRSVGSPGQLAAQMTVVDGSAGAPRFASGDPSSVAATLLAAEPTGEPRAASVAPDAVAPAAPPGGSPPPPVTAVAPTTVGVAASEPGSVAVVPLASPSSRDRSRTTRWAPNVGLLVAGAIVFPLTYILSGAGLGIFCAADGDCLPAVTSLAWVPLVGGFLAADEQDDDPQWLPLQFGIATVSTVLQLLGITGIVIGLVGRRVPTDEARLAPSVEIVAAPTDGGGLLVALGSF